MGIAQRALARRVRAFIDDTRAGATAIAAAALTVMTVGAAALVTDHVWLVDQRDVLKTAAEAASLAATLDIDRRLAKNPRISDTKLKAALKPVARRFVLVNLADLAPKRFKRAKKTLAITLDLDRGNRTVGVTAKADLGGTLFSRALPLLGNYEGPKRTVAKAGVESESTPVEVVLAIDVSTSMEDEIGREVWASDKDKSRLSIVKRAAKDLVNVLNPGTYNRVAVGVVPWHNEVRLDAAAVEKWTDEDWVLDPDTDSPPQAWDGCLDDQRIYDDTAKVPALTADALFEPPEDAPVAPVACEKYGWPRQFAPTLSALSTEPVALKDRIDALAIGDNTYSALGVLWAQRLLEPAWKSVWGGAFHPADPATPEYAKLRKVIVLLTDGEDKCVGKSCAIPRTKACAAAKSQGTEIFVIAAMHPNMVSSALGQGLRECSSENDKEHPQGTRREGTTYVFLNNATPENLEAAFADIANQLRSLRKVS